MMSSPFPRKKLPSKTIVVKRNNPLFSSGDTIERKSKLSKGNLIHKRKGNVFDNQEFNIPNKNAQKKSSSSSDSYSDSNSLSKKSVLSGSSKSSPISAKTIKSRSSKFMRSTTHNKGLASNLLQQYQNIFKQNQDMMNQFNQEEIEQKIFDQIADKAAVQNYKNQNSSDVNSSDHMSDLFSNQSPKVKSHKESNLSLEVVENQQDESQHSISNSPTIPPMVEFSVLKEFIQSGNVRPRLTRFQSQIAGFSHLSVTEYSETSSEAERDQLTLLQNQFGKLYQKISSISGPEHIKIQRLTSFPKYKLINNSYQDDYGYLTIRKYIVLFYLIIKRISKLILESLFYQYSLTIITLGNITVFIYETLVQEDNSLYYATQIILWFYCFEIFLKLLANGFIRTKFIFVQRTIEALLIALYYYHLLNPQFIDISPLRMIRLLNQLGSLFQGLQNMINALVEALKFLFESTAIVILFVLFFASLGTSLFMGLFNQRCISDDESAGWVQCNQGYCPDGSECVMTGSPYDSVTNFNSVIFSFGLMLKTVTMDDWSMVMYYTMRSFHPIVWIYYVLIIFVGGFFGFNIPIAVFKTHFSDVQSREFENKNKLSTQQTNLFSLRLLKQMGFYQQLFQINRYLFTKAQEIIVARPRLSRFNNCFEMQPRILLGSMKNNKIVLSNFALLRNNIQEFSLKHFLLPKLKKSNQFFNNLDLKSFTQDTRIQFQLATFSKSSFLFEKKIDYNYQYLPTSQLDVLRQSLFPIFKRTENNNIRCVKRKQFYYKSIERSSLVSRSSRSDFNSCQQLPNNPQLFPIKFSDRIKLQFKNTSESEGSNSQSQSFSQKALLTTNVRDQDKKGVPYLIKELPIPIVSEKKPFTQSVCGQTKILINGIYYDYQNVSKRINYKFSQNTVICQNKIQEEYTKLKRKEAQKKVLRSKNWSGNNVLQASVQTFIKFTAIFKSLNYRDLDIWQNSLKGILLVLRKHAFSILHFKLTKFFFDLVILINTLFLSLQGIIDRSLIDRVEDIVTILLSTEIIIQLFVYHSKRIAKNKDHVIQLLIVILSLIEFTLSPYMNVSEQYLRLMRSTKCLLFYRCLSYIQMARIIAAIAAITYKSYIYLTFLMFFMILTFGLVGMELWAQKFNSYHEQGYMHSYDDPIKGFMTVFNIMTNDDWFGVYKIGSTVQAEYAYAYCVIMVFTLNYFVYGIVMAILLDGFSQYLERESSNEDNQFLKDKIKQINKLNKQLDSEVTDTETESSSSNSSTVQQYKELANNVELNNSHSQKVQIRRESTTPDVLQISQNLLRDQSQKRESERLFHSLQLFPITRQRRMDPVNDQKRKIKEEINQLKAKTNLNINRLKGQECSSIKLVQEHIEQIERQIMKQNPKLYTGNDCLQSLYIFHKSNEFRKLCYKIGISDYTKYFVDLVLLLSILYLALPYDIQAQFATLLFVLNTLIFLEFTIKSIAYGVCLDKGSYVNYVWKVIDLAYILIYYIEICDIGHWPIFQVIATFIYFRPMKLLYRIKWVARVRAALSQSLLDIINVVVVLLMVWLMFAVFSMMFFENKMGYCDQLINYDVGIQECEAQGKKWHVYQHNFDNITTALPTLFVISTFDGWGGILWVSQNSRDQSNGPHLYYSQAASYLFYIAFCTIGSMFFLQLFTGVLFINIKANSKQIENQQFSQSQIEFQEISKIILQDHPVRSSLPKSMIRKFLSKFITNYAIDISLFSLLVLNCISIMMVYHAADMEYNRIINKFYHLCTLIFSIWLIIQFIALGFNRFKDNLWRIYCSGVILQGLLDLILDYTTNWYEHFCESTQLTQYYQLLRFMYMLRNLRIIAIFQGLQNLQRLLRVMSFALPFFAKILFILLIIATVFAFFGVQLFGHIDKGAVINDLINFQNFWLALLTLFKCASGDDFRSVMMDCMYHNPYCPEDPKYCGSPYSQIYFILFMLISNSILLNVFILAVIEQFELFFNNQDSVLQTYVENIDNFRKVWFKYSCQQGQQLNIKYLPHLLLEIQQPLGCKPKENIWDAAKQSLQYNLICDDDNNINYNQLLYEIFFVRYQSQILGQCSQTALEKMKIFHKTMQFRLVYHRRGQQFRRSNIGPALKLKGNNNALYMQIIALMTFKAWQAHTQSLISNILTEQQYISDRSVKDTEPIKHSISQKSLESLESRLKLNDRPVYQKRRQAKLKRVSLQGQLNDYLPGDLINPKPQLRRKSSFGINVEEGNVQNVKQTQKAKVNLKK